MGRPLRYEQTRRVIQLAELLYRQRLQWASTDAIHKRFNEENGVSIDRRTIYRDLDFLESLGLLQRRWDTKQAGERGRSCAHFRYQKSTLTFLETIFDGVAAIRR